MQTPKVTETISIRITELVKRMSILEQEWLDKNPNPSEDDLEEFYAIRAGKFHQIFHDIDPICVVKEFQTVSTDEFGKTTYKKF